jgi:hypothetical protein
MEIMTKFLSGQPTSYALKLLALPSALKSPAYNLIIRIERTDKKQSTFNTAAIGLKADFINSSKRDRGNRTTSNVAQSELRSSRHTALSKNVKTHFLQRLTVTSLAPQTAFNCRRVTSGALPLLKCKTIKTARNAYTLRKRNNTDSGVCRLRHLRQQ